MKRFKITRRHALIILLLATAVCLVWALGHNRSLSPASNDVLVLNEDMTGEYCGTLREGSNECAFTLSFDYTKSEKPDSYYIVDINRCHLESLKGWTVVGDARIISDEIAYRNDRQTADIILKYQATTGSTCVDEFYTTVVTLDLSAQRSF